MTIEQLRTVHRANPFQPFVLKMRDGREFTVHRREYLAMSPTGSVIIVCQPDDSVIYTEIISVHDIEPRSELAESITA